MLSFTIPHSCIVGKKIFGFQLHIIPFLVTIVLRIQRGCITQALYIWGCRQVYKSGVWDASVKRFARACTRILFNLGIIYTAVKCCTYICGDAIIGHAISAIFCIAIGCISKTSPSPPPGLLLSTTLMYNDHWFAWMAGYTWMNGYSFRCMICIARSYHDNLGLIEA